MFLVYILFMNIFELVVDKKLLDDLKKYNIFQVRSGMGTGSKYSYLNRYKVKEKIKFEKNTIIEEYSTFANGNTFFSSGSFSSLASSLPVGSTTGRYTCIAEGLKKIGFRHPINSVCMNSASFNFSRENIASYFNEYEKKKGIVSKKSVPTPQPQNRPIHIGHDVWIGENVTIMGGLVIGTGSVIASNSVVTKNVEPYSIVAGIPATHKKYRFNEDICKELELTQWWNYELGDLYKHDLDFSDPIVFINKFNIIKDEISLLKVKKFKPYVYKFYGLTESKILFDECNNYLCFNVKKMQLTKKHIKNKVRDRMLSIFINTSWGVVSLKKISDKYFLYLDNHGFIDFDENLNFHLINRHEKIRYEIISHDIGFSLKINNLYLSSYKSNKFSLMPSIGTNEIFYEL